jgi:hypothetical protein
MDDMRRVVIDAADVLTVLSRGGGGRVKSKRQEEMEPEGGGVAQAEMAAEEELAAEDWSEESPSGPDEQ